MTPEERNLELAKRIRASLAEMGILDLVAAVSSMNDADRETLHDAFDATIAMELTAYDAERDKRISELESWIKTNGEHAPYCNIEVANEEPCDCGLAALLKGTTP